MTSRPDYKAGGTLAQDIAQKHEAKRVLAVHERELAKLQLKEATRVLGPVTALEVLGDEIQMQHDVLARGPHLKAIASEIYKASAACAQLIDRYNERS